MFLGVCTLIFFIRSQGIHHSSLAFAAPTCSNDNKGKYFDLYFASLFLFSRIIFALFIWSGYDWPYWRWWWYQSCIINWLGGYRKLILPMRCVHLRSSKCLPVILGLRRLSLPHTLMSCIKLHWNTKVQDSELSSIIFLKELLNAVCVSSIEYCYHLQHQLGMLNLIVFRPICSLGYLW